MKESAAELFEKTDEKELLLYKEMYGTLFTAITKAIELIEGLEADVAAETLRQAQRDVEEIYISADDDAII